MGKSRTQKLVTSAIILFLLFLSSGLGYYSYVLKSEKHSLNAQLNEYDDRIYRKDKELLNLMHRLDSTTDKPATVKESGDNTPDVADNIVEEEVDGIIVSNTEEVIPNLSEVDANNEELTLNTDLLGRDSLILGDEFNSEELVEVKPKKKLFFNGKQIATGESVNLAVQFSPNSHILVKNTELLALVNFMKEHPDVIIKLSGHTQPNPPKGSAVYEETAKMHLGLSKRRVEAVSGYLVEQGVSSKQIMTAYFGGSQPKYANSNLNRRVEMEIIREGE